MYLYSILSNLLRLWGIKIQAIALGQFLNKKKMRNNKKIVYRIPSEIFFSDLAKLFLMKRNP